LGIKVIPTKTSLLLSQHKYIRELLECFKIGNAKEVVTPLAMGQSLSIHDKQSPANATEFRSLIGALQYLNITHQDLGFAVNKLSQFMLSRPQPIGQLQNGFDTILREHYSMGCI